ncbi:MAG TPA: cystathionine beta-synthase [Steroidobacteraceae bacterium]|nr:cystathionine beta-synthase [Steroidobacteraceae bacterium]
MADSVLTLIGNTPLVRVRSFETGPCELYLKLESQNPGGSIKDRIGLSMIEAAERSGRLQPGATIVEATAGNTGLGLALVAAQKGYRLVLVVPDKMSREKILHLVALGADVRITRSDVGKGHPQYYQDMAQRIAAEQPDAYYINQFGNPANPLAHETTTGPEILRQMDGRVDAIVCGVGSSGTITGLSRFFARESAATRFVLADPVGSVLARYINTGELGQAGSWAVEGIGEDFIPAIADLSRVSVAYSIPDAESMATARALLRQEGILGGSSTGTLLAAALRFCREQTAPLRVVTFVCDSGAKYLSKAYNDAWMYERGFLEREHTGDLRDLIVRRHDAGLTITVQPGDSLLTAYNRMRNADVSQLPVVDEGGHIVGILDEFDLLQVVRRADAAEQFRQPVRTAMETRLETLAPDAGLDALFAVLDAGHVALIVERSAFLGLVTRIDLLNALRLRML